MEFAGGAQSDWNASEGEPGHVLNRTHWVEGGRVEIFPETVLDMTAGETVLPNNIGLEAGKEYTVMWNGTSYTCTAVAVVEEGIPAVGMGNLTGDPSTGEPFYMLEAPADMVEAVGFAVLVACWSSSMIPMAIYTDAEVVHKLDPKFLPEHLQFGEETIIAGGDTLTWDGNTEGREKITMLNGKDYYRVSDAVLSEDDFVNGFSLGSTVIGEVVDYPYTEGNVMAIGGVIMLAEEGVLAIPADNFDLIVEGKVLMTFAKKGIYFRDYVTSLTIPGYTGFVSEQTVVKPIDTKFLPEHLQFGETVVKGDTLTWDGNTEGLVTADEFAELFGTFYKISDAVPTLEDCISGATMLRTDGSNVYTEPVSYEEITEMSGYVGCLCIGDFNILVAPENNFTFELEGVTATFPEKGTYTSYADDFYVKSLTIPGYGGFESKTIKPLDPKFLPDGVPYMSDEEEIPFSYEKPTGMDDTGWQITSPVTLEIGETYKVVWGGVEYNCIAQDAGPILGITAVFLGNLSALNGTGDSGEPFLGLFADYEIGTGAYGQIVPLDGTAKEFSIYGNGLHKLDPRLVPDGTPSIFEQEKLLREGTWQVMPSGQLTGKGESIITFTEPLVVGQTYKVRWDLDYYECVARVLAGEYNGMHMEAIVIGNAALFGYPDTGEPFLAGDIYSPQETSLVISVNEAGGEHFFEVHKVTRDIKKLDNRCLDLEWLPVIDKAYLIPEQTVSAVDTAPDGSYMAVVKTNPEWDGGFSVNEKTPLTISFQGIDFPAVGGGTMDGDFIMPEAGEFYFAGFNDSWVIIVPSPGTYTISVSDPAQSAYNKIPEEFLPDSTATKEYVDEAIATITMTETTSVVIKSSTPGSTKKFKITVDDTGTLTVTEI